MITKIIEKKCFSQIIHVIHIYYWVIFFLFAPSTTTWLLKVHFGAIFVIL